MDKLCTVSDRSLRHGCFNAEEGCGDVATNCSNRSPTHASERLFTQYSRWRLQPSSVVIRVKDKFEKSILEFHQVVDNLERLAAWIFKIADYLLIYKKRLQWVYHNLYDVVKLGQLNANVEWKKVEEWTWEQQLKADRETEVGAAANVLTVLQLPFKHPTDFKMLQDDVNKKHRKNLAGIRQLVLQLRFREKQCHRK